MDKTIQTNNEISSKDTELVEENTKKKDKKQKVKYDSKYWYDDGKEHKIPLPKYTLGEELMSAISHGLGSAFSIVALILCIIKTVTEDDALAVVCASIFGSMLFLLYTMSTIYHALKPNKAKRVFRVFDHCTIFLLIAGTYIPIVLVAIGGAVGWIYFGIIVASAILGVVFNAIDVEKFKVFSMICYLAMGWVIVFGFKALADAVPSEAVFWLFAGGVVYTLGAVLYGIGSKVKYLHSIWHFFVLGGSVCHFVMIYQYVF